MILEIDTEEKALQYERELLPKTKGTKENKYKREQSQKKTGCMICLLFCAEKVMKHFTVLY